MGRQLMKVKLLGILICILILISTYSVGGIVNQTSDKDKKYVSNNSVDGGWLEERNGVKILHVSGSHYEMGYQHGHLLKEEALQNMRAFLDYTTRRITYEELRDIWNSMKNYLPNEYIDELHGLADGSGTSFEEICAVYAASECSAYVNCFGVAAWSEATIDGELYHARSWDLPFDIKDPISGKFVHENSVLIIRKPENGYASLCPSVAGAPNGAGGINEKGIGIGSQVCWSDDQGFNGPPILLRVQMILDYVDTIEDALDGLTSDRTLGWNFVVSDCKIPVGYAVEISENHFYIGEWNNPIESNNPFWTIRNIVRRTNFYIDPVLATSQREHYNPSGILGLLRALLSDEFFFVVWTSYRAMSNEIEKLWGSLDINSIISMLQRVYSGETDFILNFIKSRAVESSFLKAWNQWAACAKTGDMTVSFATRNENACETEIHCFNLYELLNTNPP